MEVVVIGVAALLWVWAIVDVLAVGDQHLLAGEKAAWVAAVMLLPGAGALAWLLVGRRATRARPTADGHHDLDGGPSISRARLRGWGDRR
jgi:type VI protein secretion system component VasK